MRSRLGLGALVALVMACTNAEAPPAPTPRQVEAEPAVEAPREVVDVALSEETWVWTEGSAQTNSCLGGCSRLPPSVRRDTSPSSEQPFMIMPSGAHGMAEAVRFGEHEDIAWRTELAGLPDGGVSQWPRILQCGERLFTTLESPDRPGYRMYRLDPSSGVPLGVSDQDKGDSEVHRHEVQIACREDEGLRVFGRIDAKESTTLYVDELDMDGQLVATRTFPGTMADIHPSAFPHGHRPDPELVYRFTGGEPEPWVIGANAKRPPRALVLEASDGDEQVWSVDLGPALRDAEVVEVDSLAVVRLGARLIALDRATGAERWRADTWGFHGELLRRPGQDGIWGCSRCVDSQTHLRVERGFLVAAVDDVRSYVNVVDPKDGRVLLRKIWW